MWFLACNHARRRKLLHAINMIINRITCKISRTITITTKLFWIGAVKSQICWLIFSTTCTPHRQWLEVWWHKVKTQVASLQSSCLVHTCISSAYAKDNKNWMTNRMPFISFRVTWNTLINRQQIAHWTNSSVMRQIVIKCHALMRFNSINMPT